MKRKGRKQAKSDADLGDGVNNYNYYCISVSITYCTDSSGLFASDPYSLDKSRFVFLLQFIFSLMTMKKLK